MTLSTSEKICSFLTANGVGYRLIQHAPEGRCVEVSALRGNAVHQAAKAIVLQGSTPGNKKNIKYILAILAGNKELDFEEVGIEMGLKRITFARAEKVSELTGCAVGTVSFFKLPNEDNEAKDQLTMIGDQHFVDVNVGGEIVGALGRLDESIFVKVDDWLKIMKPKVFPFSK